ncbi:M15 family metallopeptidase [Streptomyces sp. NPDC058655]|uniref:M15 family metallopeptidase n=1 Tax=Streptomyces sp. NPDC058655 TaxID=3346577 RepID=UPI00364C24DE
MRKKAVVLALESAVAALAVVWTVVVPPAAAGPTGGVAGRVAAGPTGGGTAPAGPSSAPPGFAVLSDVDPTIRQDIRYATGHNFTGAPVDGYEEPVCLLARPAARALRSAQRTLLRRGLSLKVYDCYRPQRAVDRFVRWAGDPADQGTKAAYYPDVDKDRLIPEGYIAAKSGHSRGSTLDVTLVRLSTSREVDMGTAFDFFGPLSHTDSAAVSPAARAHRDLLRQALGEQGFVNLPQEWWHFTYRPEAFPDTAFDFPVTVAAVRP